MRFDHFLRPLIAVFAVSLLTTVALAESDPHLVSDLTAKVKGQNAEVQFCFANSDFRNDPTMSLHRAIDELKAQNPAAVDDRMDEVCVSKTQAELSGVEIESLEERFNKNQNVTLNALSRSSKVILTLRAAAAGVVGSVMSRVARPALDYMSDHRGRDGFVSLPAAMLIGAVVDHLQRANGATDEAKILRMDAAAVFVADLFRYRDQNAKELGIVMLLTSLPVVDNALANTAAKMPKAIDWKVPAALIATYAILGRNEKSASMKKENFDKGVGFLTYSVYGYAFATRYENPRLGAYVSAGLALADELNDARKGSGGRLSGRDAAAATAGAFFGGWVSTYLPPGMFLNLYGRSISVSYFKTL